MVSNQKQKLIKAFINLTPVEQREFILKTTSKNILLVIEIVYNYMKGTLTNFKSIKSKLKKFKIFLRNIVKKKNSQKYRRKLLTSTAGIYALRLIFPLALKTLENGE